MQLNLKYVVVILGATLLLCVGGIIYLTAIEEVRTIPDVLQNIAIGTLTALAGILVPSKDT